MKTLLSFTALLPVLLFFSACKKEIPETPLPPIGTFQITIYNSDNEVVLTKSSASTFFSGSSAGIFVGLNSYPHVPSDDGFATLSFRTLDSANSYTILNENHFSAQMRKAWDGLADDWAYTLSSGTLILNWKSDLELAGNFNLKLTPKEAHFNPKWGENITVTGKFYAPIAIPVEVVTP